MEDAAAQEIKEAKLEQVFLELRAQRGLDDPETLAAFFALFAEAIQLYHLNKIAMYIGDVMPICRARTDSFKVKAIQSMAFLLFKQSRQVGVHLGPPRPYLCVLSTCTACTLGLRGVQVSGSAGPLQGDGEGDRKRRTGTLREHGARVRLAMRIASPIRVVPDISGGVYW